MEKERKTERCTLQCIINYNLEFGVNDSVVSRERRREITSQIQIGVEVDVIVFVGYPEFPKYPGYSGYYRYYRCSHKYEMINGLD